MIYLAESTRRDGKWRSSPETIHAASAIPTVVDNLWEWKRPDGFPSRRVCTVAHPEPESALQQAGSPKDACLYTVSLPVGAVVAQLTARPGANFDPSDARFHPDVQDLPRLLVRSLGPNWAKGRLKAKAKPGLLWTPCLHKEEVDALFRHVPALQRIRDTIWDGITFWDDVRLLRILERYPDERGELFFRTRDGFWVDSVAEGERPKKKELKFLARVASVL